MSNRRFSPRPSVRGFPDHRSADALEHIAHRMDDLVDAVRALAGSPPYEVEEAEPADLLVVCNGFGVPHYVGRHGGIFPTVCVNPRRADKAVP